MQILATNQHFLGEITTLFSIEPTVMTSGKDLCQDLWGEKNQFFRFEILLRKTSILIETYFGITEVLKNFEGNDHWH